MRRVSKKRALKRMSAEYEAYERMYQEGAFWCWACGRDWRHVPGWWHGPWLIERAHIVYSPRAEDRRVVNLLCSACHRTQHGERLVGWELPKLELAHMIWLKAARDPQFYDTAFLQSKSARILPEPQEPPAAFLESYERYHKEVFRESQD